MSDFFEWAPTADRSTLERYATCPLSARLAEKHIKSAGTMAAVGNEAHDAISATISAYVAAGCADDPAAQHWMSPAEINELLVTNLRHSRPGLQPETLAAFAGTYRLAEILHPIAPWAILKHDGGQGERCGQMTEDVETSLGVVQATSEIDLLAATQVKEIVRAIDWKTGWAEWSEGDVENAFQMRMLAWLVLSTFTEADVVESQVYNTRTRRLTYPVRFTRDRMAEYAAQVQEACETWMRYRSAPISAVPAWPTREGCRLCSVAAYCTAGDDDVLDTHRSPETWLKIRGALQARIREIDDNLSAVVHERQEDIVAGGWAFGLNKPKQDRRPTCTLYETR